MNRGVLNLYVQLVRREISARYRSTLLGVVWAFVTPLIMLLVYTFVFGTVLQTRWPGLSEDASTMEFALILFGGLTLFQVWSETVMGTPNIVIANSSYVKRVVFPLHLLPAVQVGASLFHAFISIGFFLVFVVILFGSLPITSIFVPLILLMFSIMLMGVGWFLGSIGTYVRDINQLLTGVVTASMFLAPLLYPSSIMPEWVRPWLALNPITIPIEQLRKVTIEGAWPDPVMLGAYAAGSVLVALLGFEWFRRSKHGFADVL
jgi:homopolymeric O-antigen transport system permease protein